MKVHRKRLYIGIVVIALLSIAAPSHAHAATLVKGASNLGLVGYWPFNEGTSTTAADYSGNGSTLTLTNSPIWTAGKIGKALSFNGSSNYVGTASAAGVKDITTGTLSAWVKTTGAGSSFRAVLANPNNYNMFLGGAGCSDNTLVVYDWGASASRCSTSANLADGRWHHVVVAFQSGVSSGSTFYVDGVSAGTFTMTSAAAAGLTIGQNSGQQFLNGSIDDVRVYNRALSQADVAALYQSANPQYTKITSKENGLVGLWTLNDAQGTVARDSSGNLNNGTLSGTSAWVEGRFNAALSFISSAVVDMGNRSSLYPSSRMTISAWIYPTSAAQNGTIAGAWTNGGTVDDAYILFVGQNAANNKFDFAIMQSDHTIKDLTPATTFSANQWYHVVGVADGSVLRLYVNGVDTGSTVAYDGTLNTTSIQNFRLGRLNTGATTPYYFSGTIDEVRLYNRALSAAEVMKLYQNNAAQITKMKAPSNNGLIGYWSFNEGTSTTATDYSGNGQKGTLSGSTIPTWLMAGKSGKALSLNGSTSYVDMGAMSSTQGVSALTYSIWAYRKGGTLYDGLLSQYSSAASSDISLLLAGALTGTDDLFVRVNDPGFAGSYGVTTTNVFTTNVWHHIVMVFDGTQTGNANRLKVYVDGQLQTLSFAGTIAATTATGLTGATMRAGIYNGGNYVFNGYLDEARIYNRALSAAEVLGLYTMGR